MMMVKVVKEWRHIVHHRTDDDGDGRQGVEASGSSQN